MIKTRTVQKGFFAYPAMCMFIVLSLLSTPPSAEQTKAQLENSIIALISNGSVLVCNDTGKEVFSFNADKPFIPASIIKIVTAKVAFDTLGREYRFKTEFYLDRNEHLYIRGWGDPFLVSEEIELIAKELLKKGVYELRTLSVNDEQFSSSLVIPGVSQTLNPYDAINGALVVNFNTLNIGKDAQGVVLSAEKETPLTPLGLKKAVHIKNGQTERISLLHDKEECLQYAAELFTAIFANTGIVIDKTQTGSRPIPASAKLIYTHLNTRHLEIVVRELLKYSNNFIANQIFLTLGALTESYPATLEKGQLYFEKYLKEKMNISKDQLTITEGSGISRSNSITTRNMMRFLIAFRGNNDLLSLKDDVFCKSGSLDGVYNYAGYIKYKNGKVWPFVIMLNQKRNVRDAILSQLKKWVVIQ